MPIEDRVRNQIRSPHVPIPREVLAQLDAGTRSTFTGATVDVTIFDKTAFISQVLENCSWNQLEDIDATITDDIVRLRTAKKTLMSENYAKFITVHDHLQKVSSLHLCILTR
jgi:hypothetical protein